MTLIDRIIDLAESGAPHADYFARRDVRLILVTEGAEAAWLALRAGDFEASDTFPSDASEMVSRIMREQAYLAVRGVVADPEAAEASVWALDAARAKRAAKGVRKVKKAS